MMEWKGVPVSHLGGIAGADSDCIPSASPSLLAYNARGQGDFASEGRSLEVVEMTGLSDEVEVLFSMPLLRTLPKLAAGKFLCG